MENSASNYDPKAIKVRKVNFKYEDVRRYYYKDNPFSTHFINALHILFPDGERFFINSMLKYKNDIDDPQLKKDIRNFCGQEGMHGVEHEKITKILNSQGYETKKYLGAVKYALNNFGDKLLTTVAGKSGPLIATTCLEHFTALFAEALLQNIDTENVDDQLVELFMWHAAEEIEHKNVAFDLLSTVDKQQYIKRMVLMPVISVLLYGFIFGGQTYFIYQDRNNIEWQKTPRQLKEFVFDFMMQFHSTAFKKYFDYFKPDFHPSDHDNYDLAENFFANKAYA